MNTSHKVLIAMIVIGSLAGGSYYAWSVFQKNQPRLTSEDVSEKNVITPPVLNEKTVTDATIGEKITEEKELRKSEEKTSTEPKEQSQEKKVEVNSRGDRIYIDDKTNAWIEYKSGKTLQLTKNAGTTSGCGSKILYYTQPALSDDSQYALLPLYCEGTATEIYLKEISTFTSKKIANGDAASFVTEAGKLKIKIGDKIYANPFTDYCSQAPTSLAIGRDEYPIAPAYAHLNFLGQLFTASECSTERLAKIWGVKNGKYTNGINITLKAPPNAAFEKVLQKIGLSCAELASAGQCREWMTQQPDIPVDLVLQLKAYADQITSDDCILCG